MTSPRLAPQFQRRQFCLDLDALALVKIGMKKSEPGSIQSWFGFFFLVRLKGLEPTRIAAREPKSRMSTNSITGA